MAQAPVQVTGNPPATGTTVTGLANGTAYTFTVTATNAVGTSAPSAATAPVTPSAPQSVVQNGGFESGLASWTTAGIALPKPAGTAHSGSGSALLGVTTGSTLRTLFKLNNNSGTWTRVTADLSAYRGQTVTLWFNVHLDGAVPADNTWMFLDDVTVTNG